jgi:hypothetical protein
MGSVMIRCPKTENPVSTGIAMDKDSFDSSRLGYNLTDSSECGGRHTWSKGDAWVVG